jgi:hypothetical protein
MAADTLRAEWAKSRDSGVGLHAAIDSFYNGRPIDNNVQSTAEWKHFLRFNEYARQRGWRPMRSEWRIFAELLRLCGTLDMLFLMKNGQVVLVDWKRISNATTAKRKHWSAQLRLYRYILQSCYGLKVVQMMVVLLHPDKDDYEIVMVAADDVQVDSIVAARKEQLARAEEAHRLAVVERDAARLAVAAATSRDTDADGAAAPLGDDGMITNDCRPPTGALETLVGRSVCFVGRHGRATDLLELASRAGMVVQTRRARSEVVVCADSHAGGGIAHASARGARILSHEEFAAAAEAEGRARHAASLSASIAAEAEATGVDVSAAVGGTSAVGATAAAQAPRASKKGSKRVAQPPPTTLSSGVYVAADMSSWRRPLTFADTVDTDTAIAAEARGIGHFLRSHSKGSDKLAIQQAVYMVRCVSLASLRDSPARPLL